MLFDFVEPAASERIDEERGSSGMVNRSGLEHLRGDGAGAPFPIEVDDVGCDAIEPFRRTVGGVDAIVRFPDVSGQVDVHSDPWSRGGSHTRPPCSRLHRRFAGRSDEPLDFRSALSGWVT